MHPDRPYRVLVTGSRTWTKLSVIVAALDELLVEHPDMVVVHGKCPKGADLMADAWAARRGVPVEAHPADWDTHGRRAGFLRNQAMVDTKPNVCLAFIADRSRGATHCAGAARTAGIPTVYVRMSTVDKEDE
jgi:hypothetical protein